MVKEQANIIKHEAEQHIIDTIVRLERVQHLTGKAMDGNFTIRFSIACVRSFPIDKIIHKHHHSPEYNTIESIFLGCCDCESSGVMFDSPYIRGGHKSAIALTLLIVT